MKTNYRMFRSTTQSWETLFNNARQFASALGPDRLINITHSCDHNKAVVVVWYWDFPGKQH